MNFFIYLKVRFFFLFGLVILTLSILSITFPFTAKARYSAIIVDSDNGKVLYSRNANTPRYPASLTKMMTLYLAFDALSENKIKLNQKLFVSKRAEGQTPSKIGLRIGEEITVENAILAIISKSANDAATVLAESLAETEILFAKKMTQKAKQLGMKRTNFRNATGLPNRRQKTTARDMSILSRALLDNHKRYYHYFSTKKFNYNGRVYENHNQLLTKYKGTDGIKTGYIKASGFNVAASVERDGKRLIGIIFGGRTAKSRDKHLSKLFDNAFQNSKSKSKINIPRFKPIRRNI
ncbi:MAG: D-alanyl-D-alanine carboxypeptidase DacF, partial [Alphaproteobacteria bacterium MarineAlpha2_Bin1]